MIAAWMIGSTVFALLLGVASLAVERILRPTQFATRWPWLIALAAAVVWPVLAPFALRLMQFNAPAIVVSSSDASASAIIAQQLPAMPVNWRESTSTALLVAWAIISALLLLRIVFALRTLSRIKTSAERTTLDGEPVLVTESLGPAVIGVLRPSVAVPSWFLQLDEPLRALVLRHEREHCRSRDPQLVWLAAVSVALVPWNVGVWWLSRRLRLALEIDCDSRTLVREKNPEQYGKLLLLIAQRQSGYPLATMLAESTSHLSRRISAMQMIRRVSAVRAVLLGAVAVGAIAVACSPRIATDLTGPQARALQTLTKSASAEPVYFEFQVEKPVISASGSVGPKYPANLKANNVEGRVLAQFVVDTFGRAEPGTFKVLQADSTHPEFVTSIREAIPNMKFQPAQVGGRAVKQLVQQPFQFALDKDVAKLGKLVPTGAATPADFKGTSDNRVLELPTNVVKGNATEGDKNAVIAATKAQPTTSRVLNEVRPSRASAATVDGKFFEFTVSKPVKQLPNSSGPAYPETLKAQKIDGEVLAQFVIGRDGIAEISTLKILRSSHEEFTQSVKDALPTMKFEPAMVGGVAVKQLIQMPFQFSVSK